VAANPVNVTLQIIAGAQDLFAKPLTLWRIIH
jgi:hypothetical protein